MTLTTQMGNFKRMVELLSQGGKLMTTEGKLMAMSANTSKIDTENRPAYKKVLLVLKPTKRYTPN
jgi:hypothetical protein